MWDNARCALGRCTSLHGNASINEEGSILLVPGPMEGIKKESDKHSSANVTDCEGSSSKEMAVMNHQKLFSITHRRWPK
jgi:hypothetical protein